MRKLYLWILVFAFFFQSNWEGTYKDALRIIRSELMEVITFNSAMNNFFIYVLLKKCKCNVKTHSHMYLTVIFLCSPLNYTTYLNSFLSGVYKKKKENKTHPPGRKGFPLYIISFLHCYASSLFSTLFILLSVLIGLLYYMWINGLWCHILTFNCVTFYV